MKTVLVVEDDKIFRTLIREAIEEKYAVLDAITCNRMMEILGNHTVDLILLDLHLPDGVSSEYIDQIRAVTNAPLIVLTGDGDEVQPVNCLDLGADDYVTKPFNIKELEARIRAHMRRSDAGKTNNHKTKQNAFKFGKWVLEPSKFQVFDEEGESGNLTYQEFQLLDILIQNKGKVMSREELCEALREDNYVPIPRTIDVRITRLRRKVCDDANCPKFIKTVRSAGYIFSEDV